MSSRQRAQSEVIGVTLLIGVVVILVGIATVLILGGTGGGDEPLADLQFEVTAQNVSVTHVGGDTVPIEELRLVVRGRETNGRFAVSAANVSGPDDEFGLGDAITRAHGVTSRTFEVLLVHAPTNAIIGREALTVPDPGEPTASFTYVPGDPRPGETVTFDAGGSRAPNGTITGYEWDFDDGTVTSTSSATIDHSFASEGEYNVTLTVTTDGGKTAVTNRTVAVTEALTWRSVSDWDGATGENGVVHEGYGDRTADEIQLGYPGDGSRWDSAPLAFWPFDANSGSTVTDATGNGNDGTVQGGTLGRTGLLGTTTIAFDGTDDYVSGATDITALRETATLSAWIRTTQTGDNTPWEAPGLTGVESDGDGDDIFWGFLDGSGNIAIQTGNDAAARSTTAVTDGTWHHVVLTRDAASGRVRVYVDGTLEDTATSRTGTVTTTFDSIGRIEDTGGTPEYFAGRIEEMRVYDSVLSSGAVSDLYAAGSSGSLTTGAKTFSTDRDPATLQLTNVAATLPSGTGIDVTVASDPDGDGTFEETSDTISLDGSGSYDVTGLSSPSQRFRLVVQHTTSSPTESPSLDRAELQGSP